MSLADLLIDLGQRGEPYHLGNYMERWWMLRTRLLRTRLHHILRSDSDRHLHDHPWRYVTIILRGGYFEITAAHPEGRWFGPGSVLFRRASAAHRLVIPAGGECWTLFIHLWNTRRWGFHTERGWIWWRDYEAAFPEASQSVPAEIPARPT